VETAKHGIVAVDVPRIRIGPSLQLDAALHAVAGVRAVAWQAREAAGEEGSASGRRAGEERRFPNGRQRSRRG
jgi:hypothetical protein